MVCVRAFHHDIVSRSRVEIVDRCLFRDFREVSTVNRLEKAVIDAILESYADATCFKVRIPY